MNNYPDTTWEGDPNAPWNQTDEEEEVKEYEVIIKVSEDEYLPETDEVIIRCKDCHYAEGTEGEHYCNVRPSVGMFRVCDDGYCSLAVPREEL